MCPNKHTANRFTFLYVWVYGFGMSDTLISRVEAERLGRTFFFTGRVCRHGHAARRYVSTGNCETCMASRYRGVRDGRNAYAKHQEALGLVPLTVMVHPADLAVVLELCAGMEAEHDRRHYAANIAPLMARAPIPLADGNDTAASEDRFAGLAAREIEAATRAGGRGA